MVLRHTDDVSDFEQDAAELVGAIRLGYESEQADPNFPFAVPPGNEIAWLGAWLASEGFSRPKDWETRHSR